MGAGAPAESTGRRARHWGAMGLCPARRHTRDSRWAAAELFLRGRPVIEAHRQRPIGLWCARRCSTRKRNGHVETRLGAIIQGDAAALEELEGSLKQHFESYPWVEKSDCRPRSSKLVYRCTLLAQVKSRPLLCGGLHGSSFHEFSAYMGRAFLRLCLGRGRRLRRKLKHRCLLTLHQISQQNNMPIRKFERIMVL
jgi:hypothetical protein